MTALSITNDIPTQCNTVEKLHLWTVAVLDAVNPTRQVIEDPLVGSVFVAEMGTRKTEDYGERCLTRCSIQINSNWESSGVKFWENALEIVNTAIPSTYLKTT